MALTVDEDVGGLHVAVDDAPRMKLGESDNLDVISLLAR